MLAAIYNIFDGYELLRGSIEQIRPHVDRVYVIWQTVSNFGVRHEGFAPILHDLEKMGLVDGSLHLEKPQGLPAWEAEKSKRQIGIALAREAGCSHYLLMDTDEYYVPSEFAESKRFILEHYPTSCTFAKIWVYFKKPTLRFSKPDETVVPFICPIGYNKLGGQWPRALMADRTRRPHCNPANIIDSGIYMHHYSWVRNDINLKVQNSTARNHINRPDIRRDYDAAEAGYHVRSIYNDTLEEAPNIFNIGVGL